MISHFRIHSPWTTGKVQTSSKDFDSFLTDLVNVEPGHVERIGEVDRAVAGTTNGEAVDDALSVGIDELLQLLGGGDGVVADAGAPDARGVAIHLDEVLVVAGAARAVRDRPVRLAAAAWGVRRRRRRGIVAAVEGIGRRFSKATVKEEKGEKIRQMRRY